MFIEILSLLLILFSGYANSLGTPPGNPCEVALQTLSQKLIEHAATNSDTAKLVDNFLEQGMNGVSEMNLNSQAQIFQKILITLQKLSGEDLQKLREYLKKAFHDFSLQSSATQHLLKEHQSTTNHYSVHLKDSLLKNPLKDFDFSNGIWTFLSEYDLDNIASTYNEDASLLLGIEGIPLHSLFHHYPKKRPLSVISNPINKEGLSLMTEVTEENSTGRLYFDSISDPKTTFISAHPPGAIIESVNYVGFSKPLALHIFKTQSHFILVNKKINTLSFQPKVDPWNFVTFNGLLRMYDDKHSSVLDSSGRYIAYTDKGILGGRRGFVYDLEKSHDVFYFGPLSKDLKDIQLGWSADGNFIFVSGEDKTTQKPVIDIYNPANLIGLQRKRVELNELPEGARILLHPQQQKLAVLTVEQLQAQDIHVKLDFHAFSFDVNHLRGLSILRDRFKKTTSSLEGDSTRLLKSYELHVSGDLSQPLCFRWSKDGGYVLVKIEHEIHAFRVPTN